MSRAAIEPTWCGSCTATPTPPARASRRGWSQARERRLRRPSPADPLGLARDRCRPAGQLALSRRVQLHVFAPHHARKGGQCILGRRGDESGRLRADDRGRASAADGRRRLEDGPVESDVTLCAPAGIRSARTYDPADRRGDDLPGSRAQLVQQPALAHGRPPRSTIVRGSAGGGAGRRGPWPSRSPPTRPRGSHFNGKLDSPKVWRARARRWRARRASATAATPPGAGLVAAMGLRRRHRPSRRADRPRARRRGPRPLRHLRQPAGTRDDGLELGRAASSASGTRPREYGAIHFHDDDLDDAAGRPTSRSTSRTTCASGVYAACAVAPGRRRGPRIPFFVAAAARHGDRRGSRSCPDRELPGLRERPRSGIDAGVAESLLGHTLRGSPSRTSTCSATSSSGSSTVRLRTPTAAASATRRACGRS